jgi:hypothetical protein
MTKADCGCGCGGASAWPAAFVRPRFFAGQLLTEDDLSLLVDYMAGKDRLHNRMISGPGVVCGLEVACEPCGGGTVIVRPGHALDCCGNDIVVSCKEKVDVNALVRELRISSLGVDCGDPCDDGDRTYGLYIRYEEMPVDPVAPYATEEPCPTPGCVPSRIQEGYRFVVKCDTTDDHRYNPVNRLLTTIGSPDKYETVRLHGQQFGFYLNPMFLAKATEPVPFTEADAKRYHDALAWLGDSGTETPASVARTMTEYVRGLASALARYDTHNEAGKEQLGNDHQLGNVDDARRALGQAADRLAATNPEQVWPGDPVRRALALSVVAEAKARVVTPDDNAPLERRLLALGTPISEELQIEFRAQLVRMREWLLGRMDRASGLADCTLRDYVRDTAIPQPLPMSEPGSTRRLTITDLDQIRVAAGRLSTAVRRFATDAACSTLNPPCSDCTDNDVLLAHLELDGCDVVRVCSATREQVLPGGSAYGEWLPKLYPLREAAAELCCEPIPEYTTPGNGSVSPTYVAGLFDEWPRNDALERMWSLLMQRAPGETLPKPLHEQVYTVPNEVTDSLNELSLLRSQVSDLTSTLEALRGQLDTAREQVSQVREQLPERLGERLEELESAPAESEPEAKPEPPKPPARRSRSSSSRTQKPKSGESS